MPANFRKLLLLLLKYSGGFHLARRLTAPGLRILCYHGISLADEHEFRGRLFMREQTFRARMNCLKRLGHPVLALDEALERMQAGTLPAASVVVTFDDGWEGACRLAFPLLKELGFHVTLYVTTWYVQKGTQIFNVAVQYLFWKTRARQFELPKDVSNARASFDLADPAQREQAQHIVIRHGNALPDAAHRQALLFALGDILGVDMRTLFRQGVLRFASPDRLHELHRQGVDLQLHTHRHNLFGGDPARVSKEIADNRDALAGIADGPLDHFCYPGGIYSTEMWPALERAGVKSATTCEAGFNYHVTPRLGLKRILDEESLSQIEFEAELSGIFELRRRLRDRIAVWTGTLQGSRA